MNPFKYLYAKWQSRRADRYTHLLIASLIRIQDVPSSLRMDPEHCDLLYMYAFYIDRRLGDEHRYLEDLALLATDIDIAEYRGRKKIAAVLSSLRASQEVEFKNISKNWK